VIYELVESAHDSVGEETRDKKKYTRACVYLNTVSFIYVSVEKSKNLLAYSFIPLRDLFCRYRRYEDV
jgi:hypothetical protein